MDRPRRDSRQHNGITLRGLSQPTSATKSANSSLRGPFGVKGYLRGRAICAVTRVNRPAVKPIARQAMLKHWLFDLIGHVSGLSDAQLRQIEKSLPATKALIDLLKRAEPMIDQAQKLYVEAEPLIDEAKKELQTVGPAMQILIDVIEHHVNKGGSPAEAAEAVRTALDGSIKSVAQDHWIDQRMNCVTVFG